MSLPSLPWALVAAGLPVALAVLGYCVTTRERRGATPLAVLLGGVSLWLVGDVVQPFWPRPTVGGFGAVFLGADLVAAGAFWFALEYTGHERFLNRRTLGALAVKPVVTAAVIVSPYGTRLAAVSVPESADIGYVYGVTPLFAVHALYDWALVVAALGLLTDTMLRADYGYRRQVPVLLVSFGVPFVLNVAFHLESLAFDPTGIGFLVMSLGLAYATFRLQLLDAVPVARQTLVEEIDDAVLVVSEDGRVVMCNAAARKAFGEDTSVVGTPVESLLDSTNADAEGDGRREVCIDVAGERRHYAVSESPLDDHRGQPLGRLLVCRDVTERKAYERELAERNERLEQFASVVSHDLRNPLSVAQGRLDLARSSGDERHFEAVADAHDRMDRLIVDLLALARRGEDADERVSVPLRNAAEQAFRTVDTGGVALEFDDPPTADADPERLRQLLENLFRNAVEHGSTPRSSASRGDEASTDAASRQVVDGTTTITVGGTDDGGFYVEDDGVGVPPAERDTVFEYGHTTDEEGSGLGLSIVDAIAEAHGWETTVVEGSNGGARFEFRPDDRSTPEAPAG